MQKQNSLEYSGKGNNMARVKASIEKLITTFRNVPTENLLVVASTTSYDRIREIIKTNPSNNLEIKP